MEKKSAVMDSGHYHELIVCSTHCRGKNEEEDEAGTRDEKKQDGDERRFRVVVLCRSVTWRGVVRRGFCRLIATPATAQDDLVAKVSSRREE